MNDIKRISILTVALALSGCAGSPSDLSNSSNQTVIKSDATYQTLYEQIASTAKRCWTGSGIYISAEVDAGFYPNLGYGQVDLIFNDMGSRYFYFTSKIEPGDIGSQITFHTDHKTYKSDATRWASGDLTCS